MVRQVLAINNMDNPNYIKFMVWGSGMRPGSLKVRHWFDKPGSREHPGSIPGQGAHNSLKIKT